MPWPSAASFSTRVVDDTPTALAIHSNHEYEERLAEKFLLTILELRIRPGI